MMHLLPSRRLVALVTALSVIVGAYQWCCSLIHPWQAMMHPVDAPQWGRSHYLCDQRRDDFHRPYCLHLTALQQPNHVTPMCSLLLIHGTASHAGAFHIIAPRLLNVTQCDVWAVDLRGHGRSGGDRGVFTLQSWIDDVEAAAVYIASLHRVRGIGAIVAVGSSQGGEVAFRALEALPSSLIGAAIAMNVIAADIAVFNPFVHLLRSSLMTKVITPFVGRHLHVPLPLFVNFDAAYSTETVAGHRIYQEKLHDPVQQWSVTLRSYATLFNPELERGPPSNWTGLEGKHLLIVCGECDRLVPWRHCERVADRLRSPSVDFYGWKRGGHQLIALQPTKFSRLVRSYLDYALPRIRQRWSSASSRQSIVMQSRWAPPVDFAPSLRSRYGTNQ